MKHLNKKFSLIILTIMASTGCSNDAGMIQRIFDSEGTVSDSGYNPLVTASLTDLPSLDASLYDYSVVSNGSAMAASLTRAHFLTSNAGEFSRGACEVEHIKRQMFEDAKSVDSFLCYVKTVNRENPRMMVPMNAWAYYETKLKVIESLPPIDVKVRLGQFGKKFSLDVCAAPLGVYRQALEMRLDKKNNGYEGYAVRAEYEQNGGSNKSSRVDVIMQGESAGKFNWLNVLDKHYSKHSSGEEYSMNGNFDAENSDQTNIISGRVSASSPLTGSVELSANAMLGIDKIGTTQFSIVSHSTVPTEAQCLAWGVSEDRLSECVSKCFEQGEGQEVSPDINGQCATDLSRIESFKVKDSRGKRTFAIVDDSSSLFYDVVAGLAALEKLVDPKKETSFVEGWNCENEGGSLFIDTSEIDLIGECGATMELPTLQSCDEEIWTQKLSS